MIKEVGIEENRLNIWREWHMIKSLSLSKIINHEEEKTDRPKKRIGSITA
jgi:hypothetical protein